MTWSTIAPQIRLSPSSRRRRLDQWNARPVDVVAEPAQQGRQDGERAEDRDSDDENRRDPERGENLVAGEEHARHCRHDRQAGDEHRAARCGGGCFDCGPLATSCCTLLPLAPQVEQRVVDADREPDQENDRGGLLSHGQEVAGERDETEGGDDSGQAEQQRNARGHERAERDHQDQQGDRQGELSGLLEVVRVRRLDSVDRAGVAELADEELGMNGLSHVDSVEYGADLVHCVVCVSSDLELDERRVRARCDLARVARVQR